MCESCPACWRVEVADARTGRVIDVLHPSTFNTSEALTEVGTASFILATKDVNLLRLVPDGTLVYVVNTCACDTPTVFGGVVSKVTMGPVVTSVGAYSIEGYLQSRNAHMEEGPGADPWTYSQVPQTAIAADLVNRLAGCGIRIEGVDGGSTHLRDIELQAWDHANIYETLSGLAGLENGVEWVMDYQRTNGVWFNRMIFTDRVGVDRPTILRSDRDMAGFDIDIDAALHATRVRGIGSGSEADQLEAYAEANNGYPCFDAVPAWKDEESQATLQARTDGYLTDFDQPLVIPSVTLIDPYQPCPLNLGDTLTVDICAGRTRYRAQSRVVGVGWDQGIDGLAKSLDLMPVGDAGIGAVIVDTDADCECEDC